jgi:hypothetical protein
VTVPAAVDPPPTSERGIAETAPVLLTLVAGYVGHRTVAMGLRQGLLQSLADRPGCSAEQLAARLHLDPFYVGVWCRAALAAGILDRSGDGYRLVRHMDTLLLDSAAPTTSAGCSRFSRPRR